MYKKVFSLLLTAALILSLFKTVPVKAADLSQIFFDNFSSYAENTYPSSFIMKYNGAGTYEQRVITSEQHDGTSGKVFRLKGASSWASEQYVNLPDPLPETLVVEAYAKPISGAWPGEIGLRNYSVGTWGTRASSVWFDSSGNITAVLNGNNNQRQVIGHYTMNTWYHIVLENNLLSKTYNVYINGFLAASALPMNPTVNPKQFTLISGNIGSNEIYFDDAGIYSSILDTALFNTITFNRNGGDTESVPNELKVPVTFSGIHPMPATNPTKSDYSFEGWWTGNGNSDDGIGIDGGDGWGTEFSAGSIVTGDITVYAKWKYIDSIPPHLTAGEVIRSAGSTASVKFTTDEEGEYYYQVIDSGSPAPVIDTILPGTPCSIGEQTINLVSLTDGAKDIYVAVKDDALNVSEPLKITIPEYIYPEADKPDIKSQPSDINAVYGSINTDISITADAPDGGTISYQWYKSPSESYEGEIISGETGKEFKIPDLLNAGTYYYYCIVKNTLNTGKFSEDKSRISVVTINKAEPSYNLPSGLTAVYGDTLSDIVLPSGFIWKDAPDTPVGNPGIKSFKAAYIPEDTSNYTASDNLDITIEVKKGDTILSYNSEDKASGINMFGLMGNVNIPEKAKEDVKEVILWVNTDDTEDNFSEALNAAEEALNEKGCLLLNTFDISIIKRVVKFDGSYTDSKVLSSDIKDYITVRIPVPEDYSGDSNLKAAYIDDQGKVEILESEIVTVNEKKYLQFKTNHFSMYSIIKLSDSKEDKGTELPQTGGLDMSFYLAAGLILMGAGISKLKKNR